MINDCYYISIVDLVFVFPILIVRVELKLALVHEHASDNQQGECQHGEEGPGVADGASSQEGEKHKYDQKYEQGF